MQVTQRLQQHPLRWSILGFVLLNTLFLGSSLLPATGWGLGTHDIEAAFYPWLTTTRAALWQGGLPIWDTTYFAGYPFLSNPQVAVFYPPTWLAFLFSVEVGISWHIWFHMVLGGVGMLLLTRQLGAPWLGAWLAGLTISFAGYTAVRIYAGHMGLVATNSWLPWVLLAAVWSVQRRSVWTAVLGGVPFGMAILAGHTSSLLYIGLAWAGVLLYLLVTHRPWWLPIRQTAVSGLMGLALSGVQLLPLLQFISVSSRSSEADFAFATSYSMPPAHLITLLVPEFFGEPTRAGYWSVPNFEELTYYIGVLPLIGLLLALRWPGKKRLLFVALGAIGLLLALGSYGFLFGLAYDWLPIFRLTRAPGRAAVLFVFAVAAVLGLALNSRNRPVEEINLLFRWSLGITAVSGIAVLAVLGGLFTLQHPSDTSGRLWHQLGGWGQAFMLLLVGQYLLWQWLTAVPHSRRSRWLAAGLVGVLLVDLWSFGFKLTRLDPIGTPTVWQDANGVIGETNGRVLPWGLSIFDQNGAAAAGLDSVFGYNPLEIGTSSSFTASVPDPRATTFDLLSAEYVLSQVQLEQFGDGERPLTLIGQQGSAWVYRRSRAMPLARLVTAVEQHADEASLLARVHAPDFDPVTTVLLTEPAPCALTGGAIGSATLIEQLAGRWEIAVQSDVPAMLIVSETAYPGWQVTVNGRSATPVAAYGVIKGVCVPAGESSVVWQYQPRMFIWGGWLSGLALLLVGTAVFRLRRERNQPDAGAA